MSIRKAQPSKEFEGHVGEREDFDEFLNEATFDIVTKWEAYQGRKLTSEERYEINDWLTQFFYEKRFENEDEE
jgi:hypothetical protein